MVGEVKVKERYKKTEIGIIPEEWQVNTLENIGQFKKGKGIARKELSNSGFPCVLYGDIYTKYNFTATELNSLIKKETTKKSIAINKGDLLFAGSGETVEDIGKSFTYLGEKTAYAGGDIIIMTPYNCDPVFLGYLTNAPIIIEQKSKLGQGSSVVHIYSSGLRKIKIAEPPIEEQESIGKSLYDTDNLIQSLEKLIDKKKKLKQGTMQQLLTGKKRLPGFSGEWEVKKLGDLVEFHNGKAHENFIEDIGKYVVVNSKFISTEGKIIKYSNEQYCPAIKEDILMVMSDVPNGRAIAKCYYVDDVDKFTVNQRICILRSRHVISKFLFFIIDRNPYYLSFDDGVKQTNLRKEDVLSCELLLPSTFDEQEAIALVLLNMDSEIKSLQQKLEKYKTIKEGMMQELLTGRIRLI